MFLDKCKQVWKKYNPFDISSVFINLTNHLDEVESSLKRIEQKLNRDIEFLEQEVSLQKSLLDNIGYSIPELVWVKDLDGYYIYVNTAIKETLLLIDNPIGKSDLEIAVEIRKKFGEDSYSFGETCILSDIEVINTEKPKRLLEKGFVKGELVFLEVFKRPFYVDGKLFGTCGTGTDLTDKLKKIDNKLDWTKVELCENCPLTMKNAMVIM